MPNWPYPTLAPAVALGVAVLASCDFDGRGPTAGPPRKHPVGDQSAEVRQGGDVPPQPAETERPDPPLVDAARAGDTRRVRTLLDGGADINAFGGGRTTALIAAAEAGREDVVRLLVERNADANLRNARGQTAAEVAEASGHGRLRSLLERKEVKPPPGPANPIPPKQ